MDRGEVFAQVAHLEDQIGQFYRELGDLKQRIIELLEINQKLTLENQHLRERAGLLEPDQVEIPTGSSGSGIDNLSRIYQEGFHICNVHYGSLRTEGDCLFCLSFLNK